MDPPDESAFAHRRREGKSARMSASICVCKLQSLATVWPDVRYRQRRFVARARIRVHSPSTCHLSASDSVKVKLLRTFSDLKF